MYETKREGPVRCQLRGGSPGSQDVCDQPENNGGSDAGMTPPELFLASIATCAGYYAIQYLKARNLPQDGLSVRVSAEKAMQPARLGAIRIEMEAPGADDERQHAGLVRAIEKCLIHNTLLHTPTIEIAVQPITAAVS
jgi:putative redox protein